MNNIYGFKTEDGSELAFSLIKQVHGQNLQKFNPYHDVKGLFASAVDAIKTEVKSFGDSVINETNKHIDALKDDAKKAFMSIKPKDVHAVVKTGLEEIGVHPDIANVTGHFVSKHVEKRQKELK